MVEQDNDDEEPQGQSMQSNETDQPSTTADTIIDVELCATVQSVRRAQSEFSTE